MAGRSHPPRHWLRRSRVGGGRNARARDQNPRGNWQTFIGEHGEFTPTWKAYSSPATVAAANRSSSGAINEGRGAAPRHRSVPDGQQPAPGPGRYHGQRTRRRLRASAINETFKPLGQAGQAVFFMKFYDELGQALGQAGLFGWQKIQQRLGP